MRTCTVIAAVALASICSLCLFAGAAHSGCAPDSIWMRTFGVTDDFLEAVQSTPDGGLIMGGTTMTYSAGGGDFWLIRTDGAGNILWTRSYGTSDEEDLMDVRVVPSGGYIMAGYRQTAIPVSVTRPWIIRTDENGDTLWTWSRSDPGGFEYATSVQPMSNGGFAVAATTFDVSDQGDISLYLLDSTGMLYDSGIFGGGGTDVAMAIRQTTDGGFAIAGVTRSYGPALSNVYLVKADAFCGFQWHKWYGGDAADEGRDLITTSDGGYVIAGSTSSYGAGASDFYVIKTNSSGDTLWTRTVGGAEHEWAYCVAEATDGTIVAAGETESFGVGESSIYVAAMDATGLVHCTETYGASGKDFAGACTETADQGFVMVGGAAAFGTYDWKGLAVRLYGQAPLVHSITDVPYDQGGRVRLAWGCSSHDTPGGDPAITGYAIYRKYDWAATKGAAWERAVVEAEAGGEAEAEDEPAGQRPDLAYPPGDWDYVTTVPARCEDVYSTVVPTLCDSSVASGVCWSFFFVSALTAEPGFHFDSVPDSGYSVDNLAPSPPANLHMPTVTDLAWDEAPEEDFDYFTVYGSELPGFSEAIFIGYTIDPGFDVSAGTYGYYHVTATDFAGNEGAPATVENTFAGVVGDRPAAYALRQNQPNPFAASTVVAFDLPAAGPVTIDVVDVKGRLVRTLVAGTLPAGRHAVAWNGCDAAGVEVGAGAYFVRMAASTFSANCKMLRLR